MKFQRVWDSSCPLEYDRWSVGDVTYIIQDLAPEDDDAAVDMLVKHLIPDEVTCSISGLPEDPVSIQSMKSYWDVVMKYRTSLACYAVEGGKRTLVAVNCCVVADQGENGTAMKVEGDAWINVFNTLKHFEDVKNPFEYLQVDRYLSGLGLVVRRDYRGARLGAKVLAARKPLCSALGIKATATVFTGIGSQKSAEKAGFHSILEMTLGELAEQGFKYPKNDDRVVKLMVLKYGK